MKTAPHTQGPWKLREVNGFVGVVHETETDLIGICENVHGLRNARLICAAPDLLNMLQRLFDEMMMNEECFKHVAELTREQVREALKKAKG